MKTEITTRHFELSDTLRRRTEERLAKLHRFFDRIMDARVVVSLEKKRYNAEATLIANGTPLTSRAAGDNEAVAVDQVIDKLEVQVRRHKDRLTRQKRRARADEPAPALAAEIEEEPEAPDAFDEGDLQGLVSEDGGDFSVVMSVAEAAAQLKVSRREVLGFTNSLSRHRTVVFKRRDGNVGVLDVGSGEGS